MLPSLLSSGLVALLAAKSVVAYVCSDFQCDGIANYINAECGVDPNDASNHGEWAQFCFCEPKDFALTVTYTGANQAVTTESSTTRITATSVVTTAVFSFTGTNNNIKSGSPVIFSMSAGANQYPALSYTYSPVTSIYYTDTTATVGVTTSTVTTTTSTATVTSTTAIPQATDTQPCTTGTITSTADTSTITTTSTVTPTVKTKKVPYLSLTTVHASCIGKSTSRPRSPRHIRDALHYDLARRQDPVNAGVVEYPWCPVYRGSPEPTTYTTSTVITTSTATTTDTSTVISTSTVETTQTPTPLTTTVCSNVDATATITPTATSTVITTAKQSTTTVTQTYKFTVTIYPRHPKPCSTSPPPKPTEGNGCKISKPKKHH